MDKEQRIMQRDNYFVRDDISMDRIGAKSAKVRKIFGGAVANVQELAKNKLSSEPVPPRYLIFHSTISSLPQIPELYYYVIKILNYCIKHVEISTLINPVGI